MSRKEKIGLGIVIVLFGMLILGVIASFRKTEGNPRSYQDSVVVQQRIKNLEKNR